MNIDELVINKIYILMQQRGWSQSELAKQAKINYQNLNRLLKGGRSITKSDVLPSIAKAFGLTADDLKTVNAEPHRLRPKHSTVRLASFQSKTS